MNIKSSYQIKAALMWYWRYKRNMICAPEMHCGDVMVYDVPWLHEIEIKITKSDLWHGEAKKNKHENYTHANKFSICVPLKLMDTAKEWIAKTNKNYGLIVCADTQWLSDVITIVKSAKLVKEKKHQHIVHSLLRKLSSMATESYHDKYWKDC